MTMSRIDALGAAVAALPDAAFVVTCGATSREMAAVADRPGNLYLLDSMGLTTSVAFGVAIGLRERFPHVVAIDGDGSLLMNLGSLCTIATVRPSNFALVIWDNEVHMTTGGQPTATSHRSSFAQMARGAGIEKVLEPRDETELGQAFDRILAEPGPFVVPVKVSRGKAEGHLDRDVLGYTRRFRQALAALPASR